MWFADLYRMLDGFMLAGAGIEPIKPGNRRARLVVARSRPQWPLLCWLLTVLHRHDIPMALASGGATLDDKLQFASRANMFYWPAMCRWYPDLEATGKRQARTPLDLQLTAESLALWLGASLVRGDGAAPVRLAAPRLSVEAARKLIWQVRAIAKQHDADWSARLVQTTAYYAIEVGPIERVQDFVARVSGLAVSDWQAMRGCR